MIAPLPRLYAILDAGLVHQRGLTAVDVARIFITAGCTLIQYRNKSGNARQIQAEALALRALTSPGIKLIMNDRADMCLAARFDGVHLGQDDLSIAAARKICAAPMLIGTSTHDPTQVEFAEKSYADYIAIGPVFGTASKQDPDPVVGLEGVRAARKLTRKPLVAIGGITVENAQSVIAAGADSVAVISALLPPAGEPCDERAIGKRVEAFLRVLG